MPLQWRRNLLVSVGVKHHERRRSVTSSGRVWRKVPESGARSVGSLVFNLGFRWAAGYQAYIHTQVWNRLARRYVRQNTRARPHHCQQRTSKKQPLASVLRLTSPVHVIDGYYDVIWSRLTSQNAALKTKHLATNAK